MALAPGAGTSIRNLEQAAAWLEGLIDYERPAERAHARFSLDPIRALLARIGNPERALRPIHVAGSKGKGSTVLLAEALLRGAGLRTGAFTSPHLLRWTERFRIDGREVEGETLAAAVERVAPGGACAARRGSRERAHLLRRDDRRRAPALRRRGPRRGACSRWASAGGSTRRTR